MKKKQQNIKKITRTYNEPLKCESLQKDEVPPIFADRISLQSLAIPQRFFTLSDSFSLKNHHFTSAKLDGTSVAPSLSPPLIDSFHLPCVFPQFFKTFFVQRNWSRNHLVMDSTGSWLTGKECFRQENPSIWHCQDEGILPFTILVRHVDTLWFLSLMATFPYNKSACTDLWLLLHNRFHGSKKVQLQYTKFELKSFWGNAPQHFPLTNLTTWGCS